MTSHLLSVITFCFFLSMITAAPQPQTPEAQEKPQPYDYNYKVEDPPNNLYFGANEAGNEAGKVEGSYYVLLADGRLMTVDYYVDGDSGFVPKISFQENANPFTTKSR